MDILIALLHAAVVHRMIVTMVLLVVATAIVALLEPRGTWLGALAMVALLAVGNLFLGPRLVGALLVRYGVAGTATVVAVEDTGGRYNGRPIKRYQALVRTDAGRIVESSFDSASVLLYPPTGASLPQPGVAFSVRHLLTRPQSFVIVTDDENEFVPCQRCRDLAGAITLIRRKLEFVRESPDYRDAYDYARTAYAAAGCIANAGSGGRGVAGSPRQAETAR